MTGAWGGYCDGDSGLHRLDARVKLVLLLCWTIGLFHMQTWWGLVLVTLGVMALAVRCGMPIGRFATGLKPMLLVLAVIVVSSSLRFDGTATWAVAGTFGISQSGLVAGLMTATRIVLMVCLSLLLTASTAPELLTDALAAILAPLRRVRVPVDDLAMMLSIALRFIPVCSEQLERVTLAQRARGGRIGQGNVVRRVISWVPVMIPLCVNLFRRAEALAVAMEARCYRGEGRTRLTALHMRPVDGIVLAVGVAACMAVALCL